MKFISSLSADEQKHVLSIIEDDDLSLEDKIVAFEDISDAAVKGKLKEYLTLLETFMKRIPNDKKLFVRGILTEESFKLKEKIDALRDIQLDDKILIDTKKLIVDMQYLNRESMKKEEKPKNVPNQKKKTPVDKIPDITDFPFLQYISDKERGDKIKAILLNDSLSHRKMMEKLAEFVTDKGEAKEIKKFMAEMKDEAELLHQLPETTRPDVASILRETTMTMQEKRETLRFILKNREDRKKCRDYLNQKMDNGYENGDDGLEDDEISPIYAKFLENAPKEMNILILGETGVGKSTFINGLANYLKFRNLRDAKNSRKVEILISTYFTITDENFNQTKITCRAKDDGNENMDDGTSATLSAKPYVFQWGPPGQQKQIRLIDTPGVGDVAGYEKDKENFNNIFTHLADYNELHAICILLKPNESKLNTTFTYCLGELFSRLHVSATKNILFCFTNTRGTLYRPGETASILTTFIKEIETKRNIEIPVHRSTMFCFDNESLRFLCAWKEGVTFTKDQIDNFNDSWKRSVAETFRFFSRVSERRPHKVVETLTSNNIRMAFNILARPMSQLQKNQNVQDKVIQEKRQEIADLKKEIVDLMKNTNRNQMTTVRRPTGRVDTVCSSASCSHYDQYNVSEKHYKVCHAGCNCVRAKLDSVPEVRLQHCSCINKTTLTCTTCGCQWITHMHINYELATGTGQTTDLTVTNRIDILQNRIANKKREKSAIETKKGGITTLHQQMKTNSTEFAAYLKKNGILPYNAYKKEYLEKLLNEEKAKPEKSKNEIQLLENARDDHEHQVAIIDGCTQESTKTVEELEVMINGLKRQQHNWGVQSDIAKMELLKVRNKPMMRSTEVNLNDGWIGGFV